MEQRVETPQPDDLARIEEQREWVRGHFNDDARHKYDLVNEKLRLLQVILDAKWIDAEETYKLQCLGITFGDALAQKHSLEWVMVEDEYGRDPAIRYPGTTVILFPLTMISKRIERGETVNVIELFNGIEEMLEEMIAEPDFRRH